MNLEGNVANAAPPLVCVVDRRGRVVEHGVNADFERELEVSAQSAAGCTFWERWVDPAEAGGVRARIERVVAGDAPPEAVNRWLAAGGRCIEIAWTVVRIPPPGDGRYLIRGTPAGGVRAEERLQAVVDSAPVAIAEIGLDGNVRLWNPAGERLFGWTRDEVVGRRPPWVPDDRWAEFGRLTAFEAAGQGYTGVETVRKHRDGHLVDVEISAAPVRDRTGTVVGAMAVLTDIGERKRRHEEVRASRARILKAADDARRKLERDLHDGAQQRLVGLAVALRLAEAALPSDPDGASAMLGDAQEQLALGLAELRELARGLHPAILTDRGLSAALRALAERMPLPVELELAGDRLEPDTEAALYFVVSETLTNAVKHAGASSASVRLAVADGGTAALDVRDDGCGGADPRGGSGLRGLADRVEALDGRLVVTSPPNGGTHVSVELPPAAGAAVRS